MNHHRRYARRIRSLGFILSCMLSSSLLLSVPALADPPPNPSGASQNDGSGGAIGDLSLAPGVPETLADQMMDTLTEAQLLGPCEFDQGSCGGGSGNRTCSYVALDDRTNAPVPPDAYQEQHIYFVPSDATFHPWSKPIGCTDGYGMESNIGWGVHNTRAWMTTRHDQNNAVNGKAINQLTRTYTLYNHTWTRYDVMYVRAPHNSAWYHTDDANAETFLAIKSDLIAKGFNQTHVKYITWADVTVDVSPYGGCFGGDADFNGRHGAIYRGCQASGTTTYHPWGCGRSADTATLHEGIHEWGTVTLAQAGTEFMASPRDPTSDRGHVTQTADLMSGQPLNTISGLWDNGATVPITVWDAGNPSYSARFLAYPSYLTSFSTAARVHTCT